MLEFLVLLAQAADPDKQPPFFWSMLLPLGVGLLMYLLLIRPMQNQDRERKALLNNLSKNDDVLILNGIYATVVSVSEKNDEVVVKTEDNTRIRVTKGSVTRNLSNEKAAEAAKLAKASGS
jgi:preprotein translocase subunit YajC